MLTGSSFMPHLTGSSCMPHLAGSSFMPHFAGSSFMRHLAGSSFMLGGSVLVLVWRVRNAMHVSSCMLARPRARQKRAPSYYRKGEEKAYIFT